MRARTVRLNLLLVTWTDREMMTLFTVTMVILAALLLTLTITELAGLLMGRLVLTVVVTGLLTRQVRWVLVRTAVLKIVCPLIDAILEGM